MPSPDVLTGGTGAGVSWGPDTTAIVCTFRLIPVNGGTTRFVIRYRADFAPGLLMGFFTWVFTELGGAALQQPAMLWGLCWRSKRAWRAGPAAGSRCLTGQSPAS